MATLDLFRPIAATPGPFSDLLGRLVAWRDRRHTQDLLSALTDRELEDIGLNRAELESGIIRRTSA